MAGGQGTDLAARLRPFRRAAGDAIAKSANRRVLKDPAGPIDDTYPAPRDITIEDLLTHRSGLAEAFTSRGGAIADAMSARCPTLWR
jgi:CubicO group peptidase (beta-lactamase class C family)